MKRSMFYAVFFFLLGNAFADTEQPKNPPTFMEVAKEEPLENLSKQKDFEAYRFTYLPSFNSPMMFTLYISENTGWLEVKKARMDNIGALMVPTRLIRDSRFKLTQKEVNNFLQLIEAAGFWDLPQSDYREPGLDGSSWTLEGVKNGKFNKIKRSNPLILPSKSTLPEMLKLSPDRMFREGMFTSACLFLLVFANEADEPIY